ncbi:hypothetical protein [Thermoactinospora rubra]|uniref:carboxylate--amine ligase n=1 Tax=Thermoactinospora rubra TaxID=1088767 RepID=UPI000A111E48|nr:hypothetical protein [Thermoactinospora rubra]
MNRNPFHHGTLAAIRTLGRLGIEVHAVLEAAHGPVAHSRYLTALHTWQGGDRFEATLLALAARIGRRAVLFAMDDLTAIKTVEHAADLAEGFLLPRQEASPVRLADKASLADVCRDLGVPHPETLVVDDPGQLATAVAKLGYPLVAKWARPWLPRTGGGPGTTVVIRGSRQAAMLPGLDIGPDNALLLQRYIPHRPGSDWFFHGYFSGDSTCLFGGAGRKDHAYPPAAGLTTLGRWLPNPRLEETARGLAAALRYTGILDLDFRYDAEHDRYCLVDFNPRVGAQFRLFSDTNGMDVVRAAFVDLTGGALPAVRPVYGRTYLVENYDLVQRMIPRRGAPGRRTVSWLRCLVEADELAWYAADDRKPFAGMVGYTLRRTLTRWLPAR